MSFLLRSQNSKNKQIVPRRNSSLKKNLFTLNHRLSFLIPNTDLTKWIDRSRLNMMFNICAEDIFFK